MECSTKQEELTELVDRFQFDGANVFLISLLGIGLNPTGKALIAVFKQILGGTLQRIKPVIEPAGWGNKTCHKVIARTPLKKNIRYTRRKREFI